jgi:hypothetical protein
MWIHPVGNADSDGISLEGITDEVFSYAGSTIIHE